MRQLKRAAVEITLIDRCNYHLFQPLLYQVATAGLAAPSIAAPLRHILRGQRNVTVQMGEVLGIDTAARVVSLSDRQIPYDYLLVASGVTHAYFGHDHWEQFAPGLKTLDDALLIRRRVYTAFEEAEAANTAAERDAFLTFAVIGAGPTGVELAGTLAEIARHTLARDFRNIDTRKARILLIEAGPRILSTFAESLADSARKKLARLGVEIITNTPATEIGADFVISVNGASPPAPSSGPRAWPGHRSANYSVPNSIARDACVCDPISAWLRTRKCSSREISRASTRTAHRCPE